MNVRDAIEQLERYDPFAEVRVLESGSSGSVEFHIQDIGRYERGAVVGPNLYVKPSEKNAATYVVLCEPWEESERGWGVRPDGYSLHTSAEGIKRFVKGYWDQMPDAVPDEYSRPCGSPYKTLVDEETYQAICANPRGGISKNDARPERAELPLGRVK